MIHEIRKNEYNLFPKGNTALLQMLWFDGKIEFSDLLEPVPKWAMVVTAK